MRPLLPSRIRTLIAAILVAAVIAPAASIRAQQAPVPAVNTADPAQVVALYQSYYLPSVNVDPGWTGSVVTGAPGTVSDAFLQAAVRRINYFRSMTGLTSNVVLDPARNAVCQQAALMMSAEQNISHTPPSTWKFYTADAAAACAHSNIRLDWQGDEGALAIDRYIADDEPNNTGVGHRRWLLYPGQATMGMGAVPGDEWTRPGTNATWVTDLINRPAKAPAATSWPPAGYVPAPLVFNRWSFSYLNADFSAATVRVTKDGVALAATLEAVQFQTTANGGGTFEGDNTLVWELPGNVVSPTDDETYTVTVGNVRIDGQPQEFTYTVTSIDPDRVTALSAELPVVSLTAARSVASVGGQPGRFRVGRTGDFSRPLVVKYKVGGTAEAGVAYTALEKKIVIPAGRASAKIRVFPVAGASGIDGQTVSVTLRGTARYAVGTPDPATVTLSSTP